MIFHHQQFFNVKVVLGIESTSMENESQNKTELAVSTVTSLFEFIENVSAENSLLKKRLIEIAIDEYKQYRDKKNKAMKSIEEINQQIDMLKQNINSAEEIIKMKERLEFEVTKFSQYISDNQLEAKVDSIKETRIQKIVQLLKSFTENALQKTVNVAFPKNPPKKPLHTFQLLILALVPVIAILLYVYRSNNEVLVWGIVFFIILFFEFTILYVINVAFSNDSKAVFDLDYTSLSPGDYEKFIKTLNPKEDEFLVNAAWVDALKAEHLKIQNSIRVKTGGKSIDQIKVEINNLEDNLSKVNEEINEILDVMITPEEYLTLKRELDILAIETEGQPETENLSLVYNINSILDDRVKTIIMKYVEWVQKGGIKVQT